LKFQHRSRRLAMQGLCCLDAQGDRAMDLVVEFIREGRYGPEVQGPAEKMLAGAWSHRLQADTLLSRHSRHWDVHRMAVVDRGILRLALWELAVDNAPPAVVINEAIRLAKEFSTTESTRFVNGVLDAIAKQTRKDQGENE